MDGEKERRNLLVISTAVLLFFWLDLPEGIIAERVLGQKIENQISAWKVWIAVILVLAYQIHRYYCVTRDSDYFSIAVKKFRSWRADFIDKEVKSEINSIILDRSYSPEIVSMENILEATKYYSKSDDFDIGEFHGCGEMKFNNRAWKGSVIVTGSVNSLGHMVTAEFVYPNKRKLAVDIKCLPSLFGSKYSSEYLVPSAVAYAALWLATYRFIEISI